MNKVFQVSAVQQVHPETGEIDPTKGVSVSRIAKPSMPTRSARDMLSAFSPEKD